MAKIKKSKSKHFSAHPYLHSSKQTKPLSKPQKQPKQQIQKPIIPFDPCQDILLIGEGDFSFAASLAKQYACTRMTATSFETYETLLKKHPQATANLETLKASSNTVLFNIDATKLGLLHTPSGALLRRTPWDRIIFNFPHTGGLTKDVNRQVRANQAMLSSFFKCATEVLAPGGLIVVTIFEGQPYTLWNVKDVARHTGLVVGKSFRFEAAAYEGYRHARTLGNLNGGGWKGEERSARTFCLEVPGPSMTEGVKEKRGRRNEDDDSDDDEDGG